jgi:hypothetical protein
MDSLSGSHPKPRDTPQLCVDTDRDGLEPAFQRVERELGGVLLENAADWDRVIETQLNVVFLLT